MKLKRNPLKLNFLLALVVGIVCLVMSLGSALAPQAIMPKLDLPMMLALSLIALTLDAYWSAVAVRPWFWTVMLGAVTFTLLPWCAGVTRGFQVGVTGLSGGAVFAVAAVLYTSAMERTRSGPRAPLAPVAIALMLFLAGQCLSGLL